MATFKRIKIRVTAETAGMLLAEDQIPTACSELRAKFTALELAVLTIEPQEEPPIDMPKELEDELD